MKRIAILLIMGISLVLFAGCSSMTLLRTKELREVQAHVDTLSMSIGALQTKILEEQRNQSEMLRLMRADQQVRFNEIEQKVSAIEGNMTESQSRLSKIDEKTAEFQKQLADKLISDSLSSNSKNAEIEKLFQVSMSDFNAGRYDIAISGFRDLITQHPEAPLAQESEYWVAECLYAKKDLAESEKAYFGYIRKYPQGAKICVSLYKLGLIYEKQNNPKKKEMAWKKLCTQCPDSQEAQMVKAQGK